MKTKRDETLEEIWAIRRKLAKRFNYDPKKAAAYYQKKQKQLGAKIYRPQVPAGADVHAHDALHDKAHSEIATGQGATLTSYRATRKRNAKKRTK
jgi:hypothetical protein